MAHEPYRVFFVLGIVLAWAGVGHWLLFALGIVGKLHPIFHAMTQIQGFLTCFATGFLLTLIPRRTDSAPPGKVQLAIGIIAPIGVTICAWFEKWALSQVFWLVLMGMLIGFVVPRLRKGNRRAPNTFVWIPAAFATGITGSVLTGVGASLGREQWWLHELGQRMVLQGVFICLILGVGGLAIPLMMRGERPADGTQSPRDRGVRALHLLAALVIVASFALEVYAYRGALLLRGAIIATVLVLSAELLRPPKGPGLNRWVIWTAVWLVPLGYLFAAVFPGRPSTGLHLTFIGGFGLLTLAVSAQVSLGHGGMGALLAKYPLRLALVVIAMLAAVAARVSMDLDATRYVLWMGTAAALFLAATLAWLSLVARALWTKPAA